MLMVVVVLVMISVVGTAYVQVARQDRKSVNASYKSHIDTVAKATVAYIGEVLKNDIVQTDDMNNVTLLDAINDEPYDYPYTSPDVTFEVDGMNGSKLTDPAHGGVLDDTWLASSEPDFSSTDPTWPHITNLNGIYLRLPKSGSSANKPQEMAVNNILPSYQWRRDTDVLITGTNPTRLEYSDPYYETIGADADGDGILDSKWTWAPIRQVSGLRYVMAVRIIDNSSMININTATSQVSAGNTYHGAYDNARAVDIGSHVPRWIFPSELDFGNFAYLTGGFSSSDMRFYWQNRFKLPLLPAHSRLAWYGTNLYPYYQVRSSRFDFWMNSGRSWNNVTNANYDRFAYDINEMELRYKNGLNNADFDAPVEIPGTSSFLRKTANESSYLDVPNVSTIEDFFTKETRHQITTINGAATYMPPLPGFTPQPNTFLKKLDINSLFTKPGNGTHVLEDAALGQLANIVYEVISVGSDDPATTFPIQTQTGLSTREQYANQFAVSFADHFDRDNISTQYNGMNGWEAWPYITEIYTQMPANLVGGEFARQSNGIVQTANLAKPVGKVGYVIEITNPHTRPITLEHIQLSIDYTRSNDMQPVTVALPTGTTLDQITYNAVRQANQGDTWLLPGQRLIIYHNSDGGPTTGRLAGSDDVLANVIDLQQFPQWQANQNYVAGDLYRWDSDSDGQEEVFECLSDHVSLVTNAPTTTYNAIYGDYMYHASHDLWRRKFILVDGGEWPVNSSELFDNNSPNGNVRVSLKPYQMINGASSPASWAYQTIPSNSYRLNQTSLLLSVMDDVAVWQENNTYSVGDLVFANGTPVPPHTSNFSIYRCKDATDAGLLANEPINETGHWERADDENMYYLQSDSLGSVDGIRAAAISETMCRHSQKRYFGKYYFGNPYGLPRYVSVYDRICADDKLIVATPRLMTLSYTAGTFALPTTSPNETSIGYFYRDYSPGDDPATCFARIKYNAYKPQPSQKFIDPVTSQFLMDDQGVTYTNWEINRWYEVGDVVHERQTYPANPNGGRFFICTRSHQASGTSTANKPGVTGGNWPAFWKEHWRTAEGLYVDSVSKIAHLVVAKNTQPSATILGKTDLQSIDYLMPPVNSFFAKSMQNDVPWNIPHMTALMDRLTIHKPDTDGLDNDGDGTVDNPEEALVPGTININTTPAHLMAKILPVTDPTTRQSMVDAIDVYRKTIKGVPSIYQMTYAMRPFIEVSAPQDNATLGGEVIDFHNPDMLTADGILNDQEELMLPTQWLSGVASTRSDIFSAYVLIRGYPAGNFAKGVVESRRMIITFDRSNMIDGETSPKIVGMYVFE